VCHCTKETNNNVIRNTYAVHFLNLGNGFYNGICCNPLRNITLPFPYNSCRKHSDAFPFTKEHVLNQQVHCR
jgi:hypothetical protein